MEPGEYFHFGILAGLKSFCEDVFSTSEDIKLYICSFGWIYVWDQFGSACMANLWQHCRLGIVSVFNWIVCGASETQGY